VEPAGADDGVQLHEVHVGGCTSTACSAETLGVTLAQPSNMPPIGTHRRLDLNHLNCLI
jgi:hypothetical protein